MKALLLLFALPAWGSIITIGFDDLPEGTYASDAYISSGIYFPSVPGKPPTFPNMQAGGFAIAACVCASSGSNVAHADVSPNIEGRIFFADLIQKYGWFLDGTTDYLSFRVVGAQNGQEWTAVAYGMFDGSTWPILAVAGGTSDEQVTFDLAGINRFILFPAAGEGIDDVTFDQAITPEPAAWVLTLAGLALLAARRRV